MRTLFVFAAALASLGLLACENVESEDIDTSGVYADITGTADGNGATLIKTSLRVGGGASNTFMELSGDDHLVASMGEETKAMSEKMLLGSRWYEASFDADAEDTEFKVDFQRVKFDPAPESTFTMPAPFTVTTPVATDSFSRASDEIVVTWDAPGSSDVMVVNIDGECVKLYHKELTGDTGTYSVAAQTLNPENNQADDTCSITIEVVRRRSGSLDPAYGEGGEIWGRVVRSVQVTSTP